MVEPGLTTERILDAAVEALRRYGPEKTTVVDVARSLGVTHASVYRYFPSKAALRDAVVRRWLDAMMPPLEAIVVETGPAIDRLRRWVTVLNHAKQSRAAEDPELFGVYFAFALQARDVTKAHVEELVDQASRIIADGAKSGEFSVRDPLATAQAVIQATSRFHHPAHASEWTEPSVDAAFEQVWRLIAAGLTQPAEPGATPARQSAKKKSPAGAKPPKKPRGKGTK